jgi:hypothetical protein
MRRVTAWIDANLEEKLRAYCKRTRRQVGGVVEEALDKQLRR